MTSNDLLASLGNQLEHTHLVVVANREPYIHVKRVREPKWWLRLLGVKPETIEKHGAVSAETVREMALGGLGLADADYAVATSGIAGPGGGTADKPVGLVHFAFARRGHGDVRLHERKLRGDRFRVQTLAAYIALRMLLSGCEEDAA